MSNALFLSVQDEEECVSDREGGSLALDCRGGDFTGIAFGYPCRGLDVLSSPRVWGSAVENGRANLHLRSVPHHPLSLLSPSLSLLPSVCRSCSFGLTGVLSLSDSNFSPLFLFLSLSR